MDLNGAFENVFSRESPPDNKHYFLCIKIIDCNVNKYG